MVHRVVRRAVRRCAAGTGHAVATFSASTTARADVDADRERIWAALTDPALVARLTPFVRSIAESHRDGTTYWYWSMTGLELAGRSLSPSFTERMALDEPNRIEFVHDPPDDGAERAGVHGWYDLSDGPDGTTRLETSLDICLEAPLPRVAAPAVRVTMQRVMATMGDRFSTNLLAHLGAKRK